VSNRTISQNLQLGWREVPTAVFSSDPSFKTVVPHRAVWMTATTESYSELQNDSEEDL
jgi:hypothetical protein